MAYTKTTWQNNVTDIDENNLNKIEQGIYDNSFRMVVSPRATNNKWMKICNVKYGTHKQGEFFYLKLFIGDGNNGRTEQNAYINLTCQLSYISDTNAAGRFGCNAVLNSLSSSFTTENTNIKVIANSNVDYDIWFYTSRNYCFLNYIADGGNLATVTPKFELSDTEPTGTECNLDYSEIADANNPKSITNLLSSDTGTKGIDTSFRVGKTIVINCVVNNVNFPTADGWVDVLKIDSTILPKNQVFPHVFLPYNNTKLTNTYITADGIVKVRTNAVISSTSVQISVVYSAR